MHKREIIIKSTRKNCASFKTLILLSSRCKHGTSRKIVFRTEQKHDAGGF